MAPDLDCISPSDEMKGYLRKSKKWNRRFFVLREGPPPRLEYYDSEKKCGMKGKPKRIIDLENAWNIDKKVSSNKHKFLIGVYTEEEYFAMSADNITTQEMWVNALQKAVQNYKVMNNKSHCMYKHIWQGNVDTRDLDNCNSNVRINLQGPHRCCLTDKSMVFIHLNNSGGSDLLRHNHVEITIASIRSCGHMDNLFFMDTGRSSGIGTGKLWMELDDTAIADNMHSTVLRFMYSLGQDENRPRSYSSGSGSSRVGTRSRHYYNPPPSQVGMRPSVSTTPTGPIPSLPSHVRTRCESFPAPQVADLSDEARYRTSSEGENTMKRSFHFHSVHRKAGSVSPHTRSRVWSHGSKRPLHLQPPFHLRTPSLPSSYTGTSSSNSSLEHLNINQECNMNTSTGQSPTMSESNHSSDEFSSSPMTDHNNHGQIQQLMASHANRSVTPPPPFSNMVHIFDVGHRSSYQFHPGHFQTLKIAPPPPPANPPQVHPLHSQASTVANQSHEPVHSRSHSLDDNLSCGTEASTYSTSPQLSGYLASVSVSPDVYSQSPSQSSCHSQCSDFNPLYTPTSTSPNGGDVEEYTMMNYSGSDTYPHQNASTTTTPPSSEYTLMTPGKGSPSMSTSAGTTENKSGYVPMRPLIRSLPQDINSARRSSLSDHRTINGSYSPASPLSRSPEKSSHASRSSVPNACLRCRRTDMSHSFPCPCTTLLVTASHPPIPPVSCHGLKVDAKNDFSQDSNQPSMSKSSRSGDYAQNKPSDDYACMNGISHNLADLHIRQTPINNDNHKQVKSPSSHDAPPSTIVDNEYLPMSPMNLSNGIKSVVGAIRTVAESGNSSSPQYPHQVSINKYQATNYSTNSLDRSKSQTRKRTTSLAKSIVGAKNNSLSRRSKHGRKTSLKLHTSDSRSNSISDSKSSSSSLPPPLSPPGGEYVSIDFDKARRQVGKPYIKLESTNSSVSGELETNLESSCNHRYPVTPKALHDSNRNILPAKQSPPKDNGDYTFIKAGEIEKIARS